MKYASTLVTLYAAALLMVGMALLFFPVAIGGTVVPITSSSAVFAQLLGAACIGFAAANWITRHAPLGGIYGRAITLGNQTFSLVGLLALLGRFPAEAGPSAWILLFVLAGGAVLHGILLVRGPRSNRPNRPEAT